MAVAATVNEQLSMHWFTPRRLILLFFGVSVFLMAIRRLRAYRLKERYAILFLATGIPFLGLAVWEDAIGWVADRLHTDYRTVSLMCVAAFLLLMVFELLTIVSLQDRRIATLAQIVGIMMEKHGMSDRPIVGKGAGRPDAAGAAAAREPVAAGAVEDRR